MRNIGLLLLVSALVFVIVFFFFDDLVIKKNPDKSLTPSQIEYVKNDITYQTDINFETNLENFKIIQNPLFKNRLAFSYGEILKKRNLKTLNIKLFSSKEVTTDFNVYDDEDDQTDNEASLISDFLIGYSVEYEKSNSEATILISVNEQNPNYYSGKYIISDFFSRYIFYGMSLFEEFEKTYTIEESQYIANQKYLVDFDRFEGYLIKVENR